MQIRTYADALERIQALSGKDQFSTAEQQRVLSLVNARWFKAYRSSEYWPRYLKVGEARYIDPTTGAVPFSQDSVANAVSAGTSEANGVFQPTGTLNGKTLYYRNGASTNGIALFWTGTIWRIASDTSSTIVYYATAGGTDPWDGVWSAVTGIAPVPVVTEGTRQGIDSFTRLSTASPYGGPSCYGFDLDFYVSGDGAHPLAVPQQPYTQAYVTYKAQWGGPFGSSTTEIPIEFFEYVCIGAFADWIQSSNADASAQQNAQAEEMLNYEMMKTQNQNTSQVSRNRFTTYISAQSRSWYTYVNGT